MLRRKNKYEPSERQDSGRTPPVLEPPVQQEGGGAMTVASADGAGAAQQLATPAAQPPATKAQAVVRELYQRYRRQLHRWRDYRNLGLFLSFIILFLGVLYGQRQANTAYQVHRTLSDVLVPEKDMMASSDDVYAWLKGVLQAVWQDPKCGDGLCESPFEFASYSRFGCRADCGKLAEVQNLTSVQVDVTYDFNHPAGSIAASDLMGQAAYNLCPLNTAYSSGCYYDADQTFSSLTGTASAVITDMPDGAWSLVLRRDIMYKTAGAVRDFGKLNAVAYYYRVYVAAAAALAEQNTEAGLLAAAVNVSGTRLTDYIAANIRRVSGVNATEAPLFLSQFINATCVCGSVPLSASNASATYTNTGSLLLAFNNSVGGTTDWATYSAAVCTTLFGSPVVAAGLQQLVDANLTATGLVFGPVPSGTTNYTAVRVLQAVSAASTPAMIDYCAKSLGNLTWWRDVQLNATRALLIDQRLGDSRTTGKIAARNAMAASLKAGIAAAFPELSDPMYSYPTKAIVTPATDLPAARVDSLTELFLAGPTYFTQPAPAALAITRTTVYAANVTQSALNARAATRLTELQAQQAEVLASINIPFDASYASYDYPASITVAQLLTAFWEALGSPGASECASTAGDGTLVCLRVSGVPTQAANPATTTTLWLPNATVPDPASPALNLTQWQGVGLSTDYNLVTWEGNSTAYMVCNLPLRGPAYVGTCEDVPVTCVSTDNDTQPYTCVNIATNATIPGTLSNTSYRVECETPCDEQLDCNAICECYGTCGATQVCTCAACDALYETAASQDSSFIDIQAIAASAGRSTATLATLPSASGRRSQRRLLQSNDTATVLGNVLTQISSVQTQQAAIVSQMSSLTQAVSQANALATARADDTTLADLIKAGRADIAAGQARTDAKLDEIIGKQNAALAAAQASAAALSAIQSLAQKQLAAQEALEKAVQNQLTAIKTATYSGVISLTQALALWKSARRDRAVTLKASALANQPCTSQLASDNAFTLENGNVVDTETARERYVGLNNRVIAGMLLHQTRTNDTACADSKFAKIQATCTGPTSLQSFGVDPVFKSGTTLYNGDLDDADGQLVVGYYNCSLSPVQTYNLTTLQGQVVNQPPYCAELYNPQNAPYAFHHFALAKRPAGFPVFFDINLDSGGSDTWETFLEEGLYLDQHTRSVAAELVTYNAQLRVFGYFNVMFYFSDGGEIKVSYRLHTVRVEVYSGDSADTARYAFEVILTMIIFIMLLGTGWKAYRVYRRDGSVARFFASGWNWVDGVSNVLLATCMIIWWVWVTRQARPFDMALRRNVYVTVTPIAHFLALSDLGASLTATAADFDALRSAINLLNVYFALHGINILLLIARLLKLLDFQPRLGVVTRSLWLAGPDLIHFAIVAGSVFIAYAMMAHLIFGNAIDAFRTFGESVNTCFEILLGNIDVNAELRALGGVQAFAGALFFWSYELLVFMVLLNFLLAIIVDAFSEVKEGTHETVGIHTELAQLAADRWRSLMGSCGRSDAYISDAKLAALLRQWAGGDAADDDAAVGGDGHSDDGTQADVTKLLTVMNEQLDEEDLRNVLMECLKDAPPQEPATPRKERGGRGGMAGDGLAAKCLPTSWRSSAGRDAVTATPEEIALAAHYIIERFGLPLDEDDESVAEEEPEPAEGAEDGGGGHPDDYVASPRATSGMRGSATFMGGSEPRTPGGYSRRSFDGGVIGAVRSPGTAGGHHHQGSDQLASALDRLAEVQRELAEGQRSLMQGQRQLADQQSRLVSLMRDGEGGNPGGAGAGTSGSAPTSHKRL